MKDANGHVLIPHFYDGIAPLSPIEKAALANAPVNDRMLRMEAFSLGHTDGGGEHLLELINEPSLNINGISSGQTGAHAANVIPPTADRRPRHAPGRRHRLARPADSASSTTSARAATSSWTRSPPAKLSGPPPSRARHPGDQASYNAVRTPMDLPIAREVIKPSRALAARSCSCPPWAAPSRSEPWSAPRTPAPSPSPSPTTTTTSTPPTKTSVSKTSGTASKPWPPPPTQPNPNPHRHQTHPPDRTFSRRTCRRRHRRRQSSRSPFYFGGPAAASSRPPTAARTGFPCPTAS
jgi:hypothetical protein